MLRDVAADCACVAYFGVQDGADRRCARGSLGTARSARSRPVRSGSDISKLSASNVLLLAKSPRERRARSDPARACAQPFALLRCVRRARAEAWASKCPGCSEWSRDELTCICLGYVPCCSCIACDRACISKHTERSAQPGRSTAVRWCSTRPTARTPTSLFERIVHCRPSSAAIRIRAAGVHIAAVAMGPSHTDDAFARHEAPLQACRASR